MDDPPPRVPYSVLSRLPGQVIHAVRYWQMAREQFDSVGKHAAACESERVSLQDLILQLEDKKSRLEREKGELEGRVDALFLRMQELGCDDGQVVLSAEQHQVVLERTAILDREADVDAELRATNYRLEELKRRSRDLSNSFHRSVTVHQAWAFAIRACADRLVRPAKNNSKHLTSLIADCSEARALLSHVTNGKHALRAIRLMRQSWATTSVDMSRRTLDKRALADALARLEEKGLARSSSMEATEVTACVEVAVTQGVLAAARVDEEMSETELKTLQWILSYC